MWSVFEAKVRPFLLMSFHTVSHGPWSSLAQGRNVKVAIKLCYLQVSGMKKEGDWWVRKVGVAGCKGGIQLACIPDLRKLGRASWQGWRGSARPSLGRAHTHAHRCGYLHWGCIQEDTHIGRYRRRWCSCLPGKVWVAPDIHWCLSGIEEAEEES